MEIEIDIYKKNGENWFSSEDLVKKLGCEGELTTNNVEILTSIVDLLVELEDLREALND